jgi:hypothetical protein
VRGRRAAFGRDHRDGALSKPQVAIDDKNASPGARQKDGRRAPVADAVAHGTAAGNDGDFVG